MPHPACVEDIARPDRAGKALAGAALLRTRPEGDAELSGDIERAIWEKFVFLVGLSAMTSLTRRSIGAVRSDPDTRAMLLDLLREAVAVGRAKGIHLDPEEAEKQLAFADTLPAGMTSSMYRDLERGNMLEVG